VDGIVYSHLTRETAKEVYAGVMGDGPRRDDLELSVEEFRAGNSAAKKD
jgi:recombinational DNA repair ATPase RecF